jgi:hypothetical protein
VNFLFQFLYAADTVFQLVLVLLLVRGPFSKYLVFSLYAVAELAADMAEGVAYYRVGWSSPIYRQIYWTDHIVLYLLSLLVVISFTYEAVRESPLRPTAAKALSVIVAVALVLPFAFVRNHHGKTHGYFDSQWFNHTSQILNFGAAIMNLVLWAALLSNRRRDPKLVTLSIGVGIVTTSAAIAWGVRQWFPEGNRWPVDSFLLVTHLISLLLWCWLFRSKQVAEPRNAAPPAAPPNALTTPS